jgi:mannose-6-phosphate isomerase
MIWQTLKWQKLFLVLRKGKNNMTSTSQIEFSEVKSLGERDWGEELLLGVCSGKFTFKRLEMNAGASGGLQYHHKKDEFGFLVNGTLRITYDDGSGKLVHKDLHDGDNFHFPPGVVHKETAITACTILEVSTPYLNDRVRVEEKYGIDDNTGMPSTKVEDVVEL